MGYTEVMTEYPYEVYLITAPGYWYVGSTTRNSVIRFKEHMRGTRSGAKFLQSKIQELGQESFKLTTVETGRGAPTPREQAWYDFFVAHDARETLNGKRPDSWDGNFRGKTHTPEAKAKMSAGLMGQQRALGSKHSPEANAAKSIFQKTRIHSPEQHLNIAAANTGKKRSDESRYNMSLAKIGKPVVINSMRVECADCDMVTNPGALGRHIKATGHRKL